MAAAVVGTDGNVDPAKLEDLFGGLLSQAMEQGAAGPIQPLDRRRELEAGSSGRIVAVVVCATEDVDKHLAVLGGIEGMVESMLVSFGATTEDEGDPMIADVAQTIGAGEELELTLKTPRRAVRFVIVARDKWRSVVVPTTSVPERAKDATPQLPAGVDEEDLDDAELERELERGRLEAELAADERTKSPATSTRTSPKPKPRGTPSKSSSSSAPMTLPATVKLPPMLSGARRKGGKR